MDSAVASPSLKSQKLLNRQIVDEEEDRISSLPDNVLQHILSFLPTKYAVGTCILSKRWKFMWTSISNIDFDDSLLYSSKKNDSYPLKQTCFLNFVERVLSLHDASIIKKFRIACSTGINASRVHTWISSAIRHGVQELELSISFTSLSLPYCLFTCKSLTILKLESGGILKVPTSICFPSLKTFHLNQVTFFDDLSTHKLFSNCPILQELSLTECAWKNIKSTTIRVPSLRRLSIDYFPYFRTVDDVLDCEINVYAENLISFNCSGDLTIDILLYDLSSLVDASLSIVPLSGDLQEKARHALKLLGGICNVESLTISSDTFGVCLLPLFLLQRLERLSGKLSCFPPRKHAQTHYSFVVLTIHSVLCAKPLMVHDFLDQLPTFSNLTYLELDMEVDYYTVRAVMMIFLKHLPTLESLELSEGLDSDMPSHEDDWILEPVPQCLKSHLKTFSIQNFDGYETEIRVLKFILKNAVVLERMNIFLSQNLSEDLKKQEEVSDQLQMLPRGSATCAILLK